MYSKSDRFELDRVAKMRQRTHSVLTTIHRVSAGVAERLPHRVHECQGIVATLRL